MKILLLLMSVVVLSFSPTLFANEDVSLACGKEAANVLAGQTKKEIEVYSVLEVGPGSLNVDYIIIYGEKNVGGLLYKALATSNSGECEFEIKSTKRIY